MFKIAKKEAAAQQQQAPLAPINPGTGTGTSAGGGAPRQSSAELRIERDLASLDDFGDVVKLIGLETSKLKFDVQVMPSKGLWANCKYLFSIEIPDDYPINEPKVTCKTKIYHPNIDFQGKVCLGELVKTGWKPTVTLSQLLVQLAIVLFDEPNPSDPLNLAAAEKMRDNYAEFCQDVEKSLKGGYFFGQQFENLKASGRR
jgi:ubiquitin-conjugating enzyme E2 M